MSDKSRQVIDQLHELADPAGLEGMSRFAIPTGNALGISIPELRKMAKSIGTDHELALELWESGLLEARILATLIDDPKLVNAEQMERWAGDLDGWSVCDACCINLFDRAKPARKKIEEWTRRDEEFVKRAGFALIAALAVHDKKALNIEFLYYLQLIEREAHDRRNFVRKAVNWALRQIGKRNLLLNEKAIESAGRILASGNKDARWVASDALRELKGKQEKLREKEKR